MTDRESVFKSKKQNANQILAKLGIAFVAGSLIYTAACGRAGNIQAALDVSKNNEIVGGDEVTLNDKVAKSTVALVYKTKKGKAVCTGSLVGPHTLITAAHCMKMRPFEWKVVFALNSDEITVENSRAIVSFKSIPSKKLFFMPVEKTKDFSLVKFDGEIPAGYEPAKLLKDPTMLRSGDDVVLAGYGVTDGITKKGSGLLRQVSVKIANPNYGKGEITFDQRYGKGACNGDSGGPAFLNVNNEYFLFGATSRGAEDPQDHCNHYGLYTNLTAYIDWIEANIQ